MKTHLVFIILFLSVSCKETPPGPLESHVPTVQLTFDDAGVTDVWLKLAFADANAPRTFQVRRDGQLVFAGVLNASDSMLVDESALPLQVYNYRAYRTSNGSVIDSSGLVRVMTMDTTTHDFTFECDTLGQGNLSSLSDVVIINDTLAYAAGGLYYRDSTGSWDPNAYNLAKWDGRGWNLLRIWFYGPCSAVYYPQLRAIWARSSTSVIMTDGGAIASYNGASSTIDCRMNALLTGAINKISEPQRHRTCTQSGTLAQL